MVLRIDKFEVMEIVRPTVSGMTQPFQCRLEDDQLYAVKGRGALHRGLICEVYSAFLGRFLGLPIPDFAIASMSRRLLESHNDTLVRSSVGHGMVFASSWQEPVDVVTMPILNSIDRYLLATIYVFDHWIMNGDRTLTEDGGNVNLLIRLNDRSLIVIDHNLAFSESYDRHELELHACRQAWLDLRKDYNFTRRLLEKMKSAPEWISSLLEQLPEEWTEDNSKFGSKVLSILNRVNYREFWEELHA